MTHDNRERLLPDDRSIAYIGRKLLDIETLAESPVDITRRALGYYGIGGYVKATAAPGLAYMNRQAIGDTFLTEPRRGSRFTVRPRVDLFEGVGRPAGMRPEDAVVPAAVRAMAWARSILPLRAHRPLELQRGPLRWEPLNPDIGAGEHGYTLLAPLVGDLNPVPDEFLQFDQLKWKPPKERNTKKLPRALKGVQLLRATYSHAGAVPHPEEMPVLTELEQQLPATFTFSPVDLVTVPKITR